MSAHLYFFELLTFLGLPSDRSGSIILGLVAASMLLLLLLHAMLVMAVTALAMPSADESRRGYFQAKRKEWRLYAAYLRVLLVMVAVITTLVLLDVALVQFGTHQLSMSIVNILAALCLFAAIARGGFLAAPIVVVEPSGPIVRRSVELSRGNFWRVVVVVIAFVLLGILVEVGGEFLLRSAGVFPTFPPHAALRDVIAKYNAILPGILTLLLFAYLFSAVLLALASASAYRQLTSQENFRPS